MHTNAHTYVHRPPTEPPSRFADIQLSCVLSLARARSMAIVVCIDRCVYATSTKTTKRKTNPAIGVTCWCCDVVVFPSQMEILAILLFNLDFSMSVLAIASIRACDSRVAFDSHLPMESDWVCVPRLFHSFRERYPLSLSVEGIHTQPTHTQRRPSTACAYVCVPSFYAVRCASNAQ